jgi:hypothetical protein
MLPYTGIDDVKKQRNAEYAKHINDAVLSSLKMEGIYVRLLFLWSFCILNIFQNCKLCWPAIRNFCQKLKSRSTRYQPNSLYWTVHYHSTVQYRPLRGKHLYCFIFNNRILTSVQSHQSCWPPLPVSVIDTKRPAHKLSSLHSSVTTKYRKKCVNSTFRHDVDENCVRQGCYWACSVQNWIFRSQFITVTLYTRCRYAQ